MKKLLAFLCVLTLMLSLGVTAFASDLSWQSHNYTQGDYAEMTQRIWTEKKGASWTMTIPAEFELSNPETILPLVQISDVQNLGDTQMILALVGGNGSYLVGSSSGIGTPSIPYSIQIYENEEKKNMREEFDPTDTSRMGVVAKYEGNQPFWYPIVIAINEDHWNNAPSGTYESTLIYTSRLEPTP